MHDIAAWGPNGRVIQTLAGPVTVEEAGDAAVARVATGQRGLVSRAQMEAAGLGRGAIEHRIAAARLHRVRRGVYQVGHGARAPLTVETAALLAVGPGAVLSHRAAARSWGLISKATASIDVTSIGRDCGRRPGIRHHRVRNLATEDLRLRDGLPVTAPPRTLLDLGAIVGARELERAVNEALVLRLVTEPRLRRAVERLRGRPGAPALRLLLDSVEGPALTRSEAEDRMRELLRRSGLPTPRTNARLGGYEVDLLWRDQRLVVEIDGYAFHSGRAAFERDRMRDADLQAAGFRVLRVTWRQLVDEPEAVVARIARLLGSLRGER